MNRKLVQYDNWLYFLDDAGFVMACEGIADDDDFLVFDQTKCELASKQLPPHEVEGVAEKLK